jgi:DNA invertase Pin-like site-specific DNA recombinase
LVVSMASSRVIGGMMVGILLASMLLPAPGAPRTSNIVYNNPAYLYSDEMKPMAYSYLRFSTPEQSLGFSEKRQLEEAEKWAKEKGFTLNTSFRDLGASGFKGVNRRKGALADFLRQVDTGEIPRGSYLVVEDLDRLSREHPVDSLGLINTLLQSGIVIVVLKHGAKEYSASSLRADASAMGMMSLTFELGRASGESERKSRLSKANWDRKLQDACEDGKVMTAQTPAWIKVVEGKGKVKKFVLDEERASIVQDIFNWTIDMGLGARTIAKRLNDAHIPNWGRGQRVAKLWHSSYIQKILKNRAVLGEFHPHEYHWVEDKLGRRQERKARAEVIKNYFPAVVDEATFLRVREAKAKHKRHGGKLRNRIGNLFPGLVQARLFDPKLREEKPDAPISECTELFNCNYVNKGKAREIYYVSNIGAENHKRAKKHQLTKKIWAVHAVEYAVLKTFEEIDWRSLTSKASTSLLGEREVVGRLEKKAVGLKKQCDNLAEQISKTPLPSLVDKLTALEGERDAIVNILAQKKKELENKIVIADEDLTRPLSIPPSAYDPSDIENRLILRAEISKRLKRIELLSAPAQPNMFIVTMVFRNGAKRLIFVEPQKGGNPRLAEVSWGKPETEKSVQDC